MPIISRGFHGRRRGGDPSRVPPGQYLTGDFPVLTFGPTPRPYLVDWDLTIDGEVERPMRWTWDAFHELAQETFTRDIHCVTKWSKLDTTWTGVSLDVLLSLTRPTARYATIWGDGGYTTNLALDDLEGGKAWIVDTFSGQPLEAEHGGPARLLVPHLYFWKSAKWVRRLTVTAENHPGFWETNGYHDRGDPWLEQRYQGD
jgi:DMSO/TMAO reductase YedYZ molybdopterin-dependent catalytic subunit